MKITYKLHILLLIGFLSSIAASAQNMYRIYDLKGNVLTEVPFGEVDSIEITRASQRDTAQSGLFAKVVVTEQWWGDIVYENLYFRNIDTDTRLCYIENCFHIDSVTPPVDLWFTWHLKTNKIDVEKQYMGWNYSDNYPVYFYDWYNYFITDGGCEGWWANADDFYEQYQWDYPRSYYDGNGGFYFNLRYYIPGLGGWNPGQFDVVAIADGFVRNDSILSTSPIQSTAAKAPALRTLQDKGKALEMKKPEIKKAIPPYLKEVPKE